MTDNEPNRPGPSPILRRVLGSALGFVLAYSSLAHLENPLAFLDTIYNYDMVGVETGAVIAAVLPFGQMSMAMALIFGLWPREAFGLSFLLFGGFVAVQGLLYSRGQEISCGCFGANGLQIGWQSLAVTGSCMMAAAVGFLLSVGRNNDPIHAKEPTGIHAD